MSLDPAVSRIECIDSCGHPMSTVRRPILLTRGPTEKINFVSFTARTRENNDGRWKERRKRTGGAAGHVVPDLVLLQRDTGDGGDAAESKGGLGGGGVALLGVRLDGGATIDQRSVIVLVLVHESGGRGGVKTSAFGFKYLRREKGGGGAHEG